MWRRAVLAFICVLCAASVRALAAQDPMLVRPPDSLRVDSLRADSLRLRGDTISNTDRLLAGEKDQRRQLPTLPRCGNTPLQPGSFRKVFDRDSLDWVTAESVSELLQYVPGVVIERADWLGGAELPNYLGRGAASVEYVLDCVPLTPVGPDSVAVDPSTMPLQILDMVEVESAPNGLRVFLYTRAHDRVAPRTKIGASQGDRGATRYFGSFERRYTSGIGIAMAADYVGLNAQPNGTGALNVPSGWLQLGYVASPHFGVQGQFITSVITRHFLLDEAKTDTLLREFVGTRTDAQLRASWQSRTDGFGPRLDVIAAHTSWGSDSTPVHMGVTEIGVVAASRTETRSLQLLTWLANSGTHLDSRLDAGWSPLQRVAVSMQAVVQRYSDDRRGQWLTGRAGLSLPLGFSIAGSFSTGHRVQDSWIDTSRVLGFNDAAVSVGYASRGLGIDAGYLRNSGWRPQAFPEFVAIASLAPFAATDWFTLHARIAPINWFTVETVYQNPVSGDAPDASPPRHAVTTATIRSHFLRNFPSGIFDLKLQVVAETWGAGIGGRDGLGAPIPIVAGSTIRSVIELQLKPFIAYYDRVNLRANHNGLVPGYPLPSALSTFGIRWEFSN